MNLFSKKCLFLCLSMLVALTFNAVAQTSQTLESIKTKIQNKQQITNLPTVYLTVPDAIGQDINKILFKNLDTGEALYHSATIQVVDNSSPDSPYHLENFTDDLEIKARGNETAKGSKKPYRLKFGKDKKDAAGNVIETHKHDLLGHGYKKRNWTLLANDRDATMIHNALAYHVGMAVGLPFCPGYKFVDLVINGEYRGTYQISDHCELGSHRMDADEDTGWYVESNRDNQAEEPYVNAGALYLSIKNPEPKTDAETAALKNELKEIFGNLESAYIQVYAGDSYQRHGRFREGWTSVFDEETLIKYAVASNITGNHDGFMTVKMYWNPGEKVKFGPVWDFDTAFGGYDDGGTLSEFAQLGAPLFCNYMKRIMENDTVFVKKYYTLLHKVIKDGIETELYNATQALATELSESFVLNSQKWTDKDKDHSKYLNPLKEYVHKHLSWYVETVDAKYESMGCGRLPDGYDVNLPEFEKPYETGITFSNWSLTAIPSFCFLTDAASATLNVKGASYVKIAYKNSANQTEIITEIRDNDNATYELKGEYLKLAKQGLISVATNDDQNKKITLNVTNHKSASPEPGGGTDGGGPDDGGTDNTQYPAFEEVYEITGLKFPSYSNELLPASAFNPKAKSATIKITIPQNRNQFFAALNTNGQDVVIHNWGWLIYSWEYELEGEALKAGIAGQLYLRTDGDKGGYTVVVINHGTDDIDDPGTDTPVPGPGGTDDPKPEKHEQKTNLPTIYLTSEAAVGDAWGAASIEVFDKNNVLRNGTEWSRGTADLSMQYQGSGAAGSKNSYRLKFETKTALLTSDKFKQWVLASNDDDPTMMNNALAKVMGDALGLPFTPGYQFIDLYLNDTYMGTYQLTDRIKVESGRAMVTGGNKDLDWHVRLNDDTEYKEDKPTYYVAGTTGLPYLVPKNPDPKDLTSESDITALLNEMKSYFSSNIFALEGGHYTKIADNVDKDQLIAWYICQEILSVYKGFSSIEVYRSISATDQKLHMALLWDNEKALGNVQGAPAIDMSDLNTADSYKGLMINYAAYGLMKNLFADLWKQKWFANGVKNLWETKHTTLLTTLKNKTAALKTELAQSQPLNAAAWSESLYPFNTYDQAVVATNTYLDNRFAYLDAKFTALAAAVPCDVHTYTKAEYAVQDDKTYRRKCDVCGTAETSGDVYYQYTIYKESKETDVVYSTSKTYLADNAATYKNLPNALAVVEADGLTGTNVVSNGKCSKVVIVDGHPFYNPKKFTAQEAEYTRKVTNTWGTVCLPFKVLATDEVKYYVLQDVTADGNEGLMCFVEAESTGGQNPMAFRKLNSSATTVTFTSGKPIDGVTVKKTREIGDVDTSSEPCNGWRMLGNVDQEVVLSAADDAGMYYISGNKFWHATSTLTVAPFRAYFSTTSSSQAARFRISSLDADGIEQIWCDQEMTVPVVTDIMGRTVRPDLQHSPGIYVVNGQKVMLR